MARPSPTVRWPAGSGSGSEAGPPTGFSLTELLVASSIAMIVMASLASLFGIFSRALSQTQATSDLTTRMRSTAWQLRQDLAGLTVTDVSPVLEPASDAGYFELIEGNRRDRSAAHGSATIEADTDDVLLFTTRSSGTPFMGRYGSSEVQESRVAEVAWFLRLSSSIGPTQLYTLRRRQLIVVNYLGRAPFLAGGNMANGTLVSVQQSYDISLRQETSALVPNALGDLTKRENRFLHTATFPHGFPGTMAAGATFDGTSRDGEDVVLTNVVAFDVRVFDPQARAQTLASAMTRYPGDPGYGTGNGSFGAYVDLGSHGTGGLGTSAVTPLTAAMNARSRLTAAPTYDTWSLHYEFNGADEDGQFGADQGVNGIDDNADDLADNPAEFETAPPYAAPLRGIEIRIRCYEPTSKQVRQITVRHTFLRR